MDAILDMYGQNVFEEFKHSLWVIRNNLKNERDAELAQAIEHMDAWYRLFNLQDLTQGTLKNIERYLDFLPYPAWLKGTSGEMYFVNNSYEKEWGIPKPAYRGVRDNRFWGEQSETFIEFDKQVANSMSPQKMHKEVKHPITGIYKKWEVYKFPVVILGEFLAVGGIAREV